METVFEAKVLWAAILALAEAVLTLHRARDLIFLAKGNAKSSAVLDVVTETADRVLKEIGGEFGQLRNSEDPEVRALVQNLLHRLHGTPAPHPVPDDREETGQ